MHLLLCLAQTEKGNRRSVVSERIVYTHTSIRMVCMADDLRLWFACFAICVNFVTFVEIQEQSKKSKQITVKPQLANSHSYVYVCATHI